MITVYNVPPDEFIVRLAEKLKDKITFPEWAKFVKSGSFKERPPIQDDFWYIRAASILRSIYIKNAIGVSRLRTKYGGRIKNTHRRKEVRKASGKIIRNILQQLEKAGLLYKTKKGRALTPEGRSFMDKVAFEVKSGEHKRRNTKG